MTAVLPPRAVGGGRITLHGRDLAVEPLPGVTVGGVFARVVFASPSRYIVLVPTECAGGLQPVSVAEANGQPMVDVARPWATGLHQVDNPVFDRGGNLFVTYSGSRGQETPVSIFRVTRSGSREPFASGIVNATSMAMGPDDCLYVSSRFEGAVYRVESDGVVTQIITDLGVACGLAFDADGWLYVGDRSGTIFRVRDGKASTFATLPPSIAAFHLAMSVDGQLIATAPTLSAHDHVYCIDREGQVHRTGTSMGRPQGVAFGPDGALYVVEALAGTCGLWRLPTLEARAELVVSAPALVGVAFGPSGEMVVASNETAYRFF